MSSILNQPSILNKPSILNILNQSYQPYKLVAGLICILSAYTPMVCSQNQPYYTSSTTTATTTQSAEYASHDANFLALRTAALKNKAAQVEQIAASIPADYPLFSFVAYWRLKVRLEEATDTEIQEFLKKYQGQFIADRLRNDWLLLLGKRRDWQQFAAQHPLFVLADDGQVDCYALASQAAQGLAVREAARTVLLRNATQLAGEGCFATTLALSQANILKPEDIWDIIHVLAEGKHVQAAKQLAGQVGVTPQALEQAISSPNKALNQITLSQTAMPLALKPVALAALARLGQWGHEAVLPHAAIQGAAACAQNLGKQCTSWLKPNGNLISLPETLDGLGSDNALEWAMRAALREQDWRLITQLVPRLPKHVRTDATWVYWQAYALEQLQQPEAARTVYASLLNNPGNRWGFYALLAQEALGQTLTLPVAPVLDEALIASALQRPELERMDTFYRLGLRSEGNREWNWLVRHVPEAQLPQYAEVAKRLGLLDRMISTSERAKSPQALIDFTQRFPMPYLAKAQPIADSVGLDSNWVYGLMRQESRFVSVANSSVGARGLMQIMPATGAFVAKKIGMTGYTPDQLSEITVNLTLGHGYLAMLMNDLDHSAVLATAGYNAGPGRSKTWRAALPSPVFGAIFAETIPFAETRGYVKNVLANATVYGVLTGNHPRSLQSWLGTITPKNKTDSALP